MSKVPPLVREMGPAMAVYATIRTVAMVALHAEGHRARTVGLERLVSYDALWLLDIAEHGYDGLDPVDAAGVTRSSNIAFFPLYPLAVRFFTRVVPVGAVSAALIVTALSGLVAAAGLHRLARAMGDDRDCGLVLVALWASWPHSVVLSMPYTEALFVALTVWSLVALLRGRWITAGVLALLAGATRSVGTALAVAVVAAALTSTVATWRAGGGPARRPLVAAVLAPLGFLTYWVWLARMTGRSDAWFWVQAHQWHSRFDGGAFEARTVAGTLVEGGPRVLVVCALTVLASVVLLVALALTRPPLPVLVYTALCTWAAVGQVGFPHSKARLLLCAFPLLLPAARWMVRAPRPLVVAGVVLIAVGSAVDSAWTLVRWPFSP